MRIIAYTYEADVHCVECTKERFSWVKKYWGYPEDVLDDEHGIPTNLDDNGRSYLDDNEGNPVHPLFSTDEWQEFDAWFLEENPTQYLACGDCHGIIDEYTHIDTNVSERISNG